MGKWGGEGSDADAKLIMKIMIIIMIIIVMDTHRLVVGGGSWGKGVGGMDRGEGDGSDSPL